MASDNINREEDLLEKTCVYLLEGCCPEGSKPESSEESLRCETVNCGTRKLGADLTESRLAC